MHKRPFQCLQRAPLRSQKDLVSFQFISIIIIISSSFLIISLNFFSAPSKGFFREKVWDHLEKKRLAAFPHPIFGRIPNFKGADKAAAKLQELKEFQTAKKVEVNPDKALEAARALVVDVDKVLYVPVPKLEQGFLKRISFCKEDKPQNIRQCVSRWGIELLGKDVQLDEDLHIDLLVLGSVAVSKEGHRIGKGRGYADLEYAILKEINAVNEETIIVTTVHDSQVCSIYSHR